MRRILIATLLTCSLGSLASAQVLLEYRKDDGTTDFTSRSNLANQDSGWITEHWRVGEHLGGLMDIQGLVMVIQDQNCSTTEAFQFGILNEYIDPATMLGTGVPDEANPPYVSAQINMPACNGGTPNVANAWIYTQTPANPILGPFTNDLFPGTLAPPGLNWTADGFSTHISITNQGNSWELPNMAALAISQTAFTPGSYPGANYTVSFALGTGPGSPGGSINNMLYPSWRILTLRLQTNSHVGRAGSRDTTGYFASVPAVNPDNFGMAGAFPDATDQAGTAPQRFDTPVYRSENSGLAGAATSFSMVLLSQGTARQTLGTPVGLPLAGIGDLELDPTDPLFNAMLGGLSGTLGLMVPNAASPNDVVFDVDLLGIRWVFQPGLKLYGQMLDFDLATGALSLSSLFQADYM